MSRLRVLVPIALAMWALSPKSARAEKRLDLENELRLLEQGQRPELSIPGAKNRVAVFTYEDPDETGLGNALGSLVAREILLHSGVTSIGVLRYEGGLSPAASESLSYFDKVERVTEAQQVTLAVWGAVRVADDTLIIETFVQIPREQLDRSFRWSIRLPEAMHREELVAHLQPDRILAQHLETPTSAADAIRIAARSVDELRKEPRPDAEVIATLPIGSVYYVDRTEGDWSYLNAGPGRAGWVPTRGSCTGDCATLLESARFVGALLRYVNAGEVPEVTPTLGVDARAVADQIRMFQVLDRGAVDEVQWVWAQVKGEERGPTFANLRAMVHVAIDLKQGLHGAHQRGGGSAQEAYERVALGKTGVLDVAFELADASLADPRNTDILHNLGVLFAYGGDGKRAELARDLAAAGSK